jgi:hypothetical protein
MKLDRISGNGGAEAEEEAVSQKNVKPKARRG